VLAFLRGTPEAPRCGFSAATVELLAELGGPVEFHNAVQDPEFRYVLAARSGLATLPQIFVGGALIGDYDATRASASSGALAQAAAAARA
jgi:monothiol glutaredoxin